MIDHQYTTNIMCPYCGDEDIDSWEHHLDGGDEEEIECGCGKKYTATCIITVQYTTYKNQDDCIHRGSIFCDECGMSLKEE